MTASAAPNRGRLAGVDYGSKRIGLAISDSGQSVAAPFGGLPGTGTVPGDAANVARWANDEETVGIVVGLPLNMDGTDSAQTTVARDFARLLKGSAALPVELYDERLSTFQADELMAEANVPAAKRRKMRDAFAAQVILQSFLDQRRAEHETAQPNRPPPQ